MLADLMFRKNEYDSAMFHFQQLLQMKAGKFLYKFSIVIESLKFGIQVKLKIVISKVIIVSDNCSLIYFMFFNPFPNKKF